MGLNEDFGDRENVGSASLSMQRARYGLQKLGNNITDYSSEQARAAEQGVNYVSEVKEPAPMFKCRSCSTEQEATCAECGALLVDRVPTQPPAGDVLERTLDAFMPGWKCEPSPERQRKRMAAALAVAQQERYAQWEKAIGEEISEGWGLHVADVRSILHRVRYRLAKPAERVTVRIPENEWPSKFLNVFLDGVDQGVQFLEKRDAERYAAGLREELKAGKQ